MADFRMKDKVCVVTGASRGIGRAITERFCGEGAIVYATARSDKAMDEWAERLNEEKNGKIVPVYFDVCDTDGIKALFKRVKQEYGRTDVIVNNAGMVLNEALGMISKERTRAMFDVNVIGPLELTQLFATRFMVKQQSGSIVNIASIVGVEGSRGQIAYSASKGAVISMTKSMAKELAPHNIRVNAVAPGMIETERLKVTIKEQYKEHIPPIGMKRLGTPEEIAEACLYFASDMSSYTTGQILTVGGGYDTLIRALYDIRYEAPQALKTECPMIRTMEN